MIVIYTGVPGSSKSLHAAQVIRYTLNRPTPRPVIANFRLAPDAPLREGRRDYFIYRPNDELTPDYLCEFATKFWSAAPEMFHEDFLTLVVDEVQLLMNCRSWNRDKNRMDWLEFLSQHRKYGYLIILIAQSAKMVDNQFRMLIEIEINHRKVQSMGLLGRLLAAPFRGNLYLQVRTLFQTGERLGCDLAIGARRDFAMYDSYARFEQVASQDSSREKPGKRQGKAREKPGLIQGKSLELARS